MSAAENESTVMFRLMHRRDEVPCDVPGYSLVSKFSRALLSTVNFNFCHNRDGRSELRGSVISEDVREAREKNHLTLNSRCVLGFLIFY